MTQTRRGILFLLAAVMAFTLMDSAAKALVQTYPAPMVIWARFLVMLGLVLVLLRGRTFAMARTQFPMLHLYRCATQFGATALFFASLSQIGLAEASAIADTAPVLITLGAALFLGEPLGKARVVAVGLALGGAMVIIRPGADVFSPAALLPLGAAFCYAGNVLLTRRLGPHESLWTAMILASCFGTLAGTLWLPWVWQPIRAEDLPTFLVVGLLGAVAQLTLIRAFSIAEASVLAPFAYVSILFATLWGVVFHQEFPDGWTILGALVIVGAGLYVWHHDSRRDRL